MPTSNLLAPFIIAIGGGTGSGKTTLAQGLAERHAELGVAVVEQDCYYKDRSHLSEEARSLINYDEPSALDHDLLFQHFDQLAKGLAVEKPRYCFASHTRSAEVDQVPPTPIIILEGLFALWDARLRALTGLKIYVDADADLRLIRRLRRDVVERGRTVESVTVQYLSSVRPMHRLHIEPTKAHADLVLDTTAESLEDCLNALDRALAQAQQVNRDRGGVINQSIEEESQHVSFSRR